MTDKPILFSGPMVRAILDGRKTQTRRVLTSLPGPRHTTCGWQIGSAGPVHRNIVTAIRAAEKCSGRTYLRYHPGDRLYVREASIIAPPGWTDSPVNPQGPKRQEVGYACCADTREAARDYKLKVTPSIHMPRWASRLTLYVTAVKVERLQGISEEDAKAEGVIPQYPDASDLQWARDNDIDMDADDPVWLAPGTRQGFGPRRNDPQWGPTPQFAFRCLWDSINAKRRGCAWEDNPWVVAVTFNARQGNIDSLPKELAA